MSSLRTIRYVFGYARDCLPRGFTVRTITACDAQVKLEERTGLGINRSLLADKPEKTQFKTHTSGSRPEHLNRATADIRSCTKSGDFNQGWKIFRAASDADAVLWDAALNLCAKTLKKDQAWQLWAEMPQASKSIVSYNVMLDLCKRCKDAVQAEHLFAEMDARGLDHNIITHNTLISALGMAGEHEQALARFKAIPQQVLADASVGNRQVAYQVVMIALARAGDYARVRELFQDMVAAGTPANNTHFNALMTACAANGPTHADTAQQVFSGMSSYQVVPDTANWTILLSCHKHNLPRCKEIVGEMKGSSVALSGLTYQELLEAHVIARDAEGAKMIAENLKQLGQWGQSSKVIRLLQRVERLQ